MSDPHIQREDERAREDEEYGRQLARERADRVSDHVPAPVECSCGGELCPRCGEHVWEDGSCSCTVSP